MYFNYIAERQDRMHLTSESGFALFDLSASGELYIADLYVVPEKRGSGALEKLINGLVQIGRQYRMEIITGRIYPGVKGADRTLAAAQKVGFRLHSAEAGCIIIKKIIERDV